MVEISIEGRDQRWGEERGRKGTGVYIRTRYIPCLYSYAKMDSTCMYNLKELLKKKSHLNLHF